MNHKSNIRLLNTVKGQIEGIIKMIENERYCIDISNQILASIAVLKKINNNILTNHLNSCVKDNIKEEEQYKINEIINIINKLE